MTEPLSEMPRLPDSPALGLDPAPRCLVSGSSGMIGTELVRSWSHDPIHVMRLSRQPKDFAAAGAVGDIVPWDAGATPDLPHPDVLKGVVAAVHLSGANVAAGRWTEKYKREIVSSRVKSTQALAKALAQLNPLPRVLVCASAIGFYGNRGDEVLTEESPAGAGFLAETCVAWEAAAQIAGQAGIRVVHARFGMVLSPQGGALKRLLPLFRLGLGGKLGDGRAWMPWITLRDAVGILRFCVDQEGIRGPVNAVAPNPVTNADFTKSLAAALHRPATLPAPAFALRLAFGQMADQALLASARVTPAALVRAGYRFLDPEIAPALRNLVAKS